MSIKLAPRKIYIPPEEEEQPIRLTPQKTKDGRKVIGYIPDDYEHHDTHADVGEVST